MQCNKSHFGKPYQDTLTRLLGNSKKTKTNSLWIVLNYAMWNSLISIIDIWFRIPFPFPWFRFRIPYFSARWLFGIIFLLSTRKRNSDWKRNLAAALHCRWPKGSRPLRTRLHKRDSWGLLGTRLSLILGACAFTGICNIRTHSRPQSHSALFLPFYKVLSSSENIRKTKKRYLFWNISPL